MFVKLNQSGRVTYGVTNYVADDKSDVANLPRCVMGSTVYVIHTKETFMMDSNNVWYPIDSDSEPIKCNCVEESTIWGDLKEAEE